MKKIVPLLASLLLALFTNLLFAADFDATNFGVVADGKTDDGPAILKMLQSARKVVGEPVHLVFPKNKVIRAITAAEDGYLFSLGHMKHVTIEGNGSTFMLAPDICMVNLSFARNAALKDFNVDYSASMFIETTIQAMDAKKGFIDVKPLELGESDHLGGPTKQKGEQWFGGFVWCENGAHPKAARHYGVKSTQKLDNDRTRIFKGDGISPDMAKAVIPGVTRFSMPRAGVAQRRGPGPLFCIHDASDIRLERITVWSAPWFSFSIYRCEGTCEFHDVNVVPKPGTTRLMSGCRDAFHVTANRAKLIFDGCDTRGTGDDDYNFCILSSAVQKVLSPNKIVIRQKFPIQYSPMRVGETLMAMNSGNSVLGSAKILSYEEAPLKNGEPFAPDGSCPEVTITLANPIPGLEHGFTVWSKEAANPDTTMRNCTASFSTRIQTSLKIDHCKFTCYTESYGMSNKERNVEGPGPGSIWIAHSEFETGRGAGLVTRCGGVGPLAQTCIQKIHIEDSVFHAPLRITKARSITLLNNRFHDDVKIQEYENLEMQGNTRKGTPFSIDAAQQKRNAAKPAK